MTRLGNGLILETMCEDLTDFYADAIILPNSRSLDWDSGLMKRVTKKAGKSTLAIAKRNVPIPLGEAIVTTGGGLLSSFIVHVALFPSRGEISKSEGEKKNLLRAAIQNALQRCTEIELESVGMPNLATYLGFSVENSVPLLLTSIAEWRRPGDSVLRKVFCLFDDKEQFEVFEGMVSTLSV